MTRNWELLGSNSTYSHVPLEVCLDDLAAMGLTALDFVPQAPHFWCSHTEMGDAAALRRMLEARGLRASVITPPPYRYSITAPAGMQRQATLDYYRRCILLAASLGADRVVLGAEGACWDLERDRLLDQAAQLLDRLCPTAAAAGVKLLLMPVLGPDAPLAAQSPVLGPAEELMGVIRRVDSPWLGVCLDTNAMSVWGDDIPGWFARLGTCTHLVRLCDGNYHGWRAWGEGCLPMDRYLEQLEAAGYRGELSLLVPGERYVDRPGHPLRQALAALRTGGRT